MLFHSPTFIIFFGIFLCGLPFVKGEWRVIYICLFSYIFYGWWYPPYLLILIGLSVFAHYFSLANISSRMILLAGIALSLLPLAFFKYAGFISENLEAISGHEISFESNLSLPIGISFISFTAIAYIIDTRKQRELVERKFWHTALFFSFFPQLIAGPILRAQELLPQISRIRLVPSEIKFALLLFAIGIVKKVGVADQLAPVVDQIYSGDAPLDFATSLVAFYAFSVQIYCDFSGYTDMALGLGLLLGVRLPLNFNKPYCATSIRDFWRRWHMTLSRFLRDYLYIPLGGSQNGMMRMIFTLLATMLLGGLWHGAAWTFVIWGGIHGVFIAIEHLMEKAGIDLSAIPKWLKNLFVIHLVGIAWIFFRAPDFNRAGDVIAGFVQMGDWTILVNNPLVPILVLGTFLLHRKDSVMNIRSFSERTPSSMIITLSIMLILICSALSINNPSAFIYFDF